MVPASTRPARDSGFSHEVFLYSGRDDLVDTCARIVGESSRAGNPVLVALPGDSLDALRRALGGAPPRVELADMTDVGRNPGRIISAWHRFADRHRDEPGEIVGIGESAWQGRTRNEIVECGLHEALCNEAFADAASFRAICPYDADQLDDEALDIAVRTHPALFERQGAVENPAFVPDHHWSVFRQRLPEPPVVHDSIPFDIHALGDVRRAALDTGLGSGLSEERARELVVAVSEVAANSVRHGNGRGRLRSWRDETSLVFEVTDDGRLQDVHVGRARPDAHTQESRGLWLTHLTQVRSGPWGTQVRLTVWLHQRP